ncbi:glycosyltransferase 87 family protein [Actinoplanes campanulatus]|uniref:glycosyltransferase 87 family protein n=1 Tax=Actinoplanes campanulatus TaxID=113559 RepID=UPI001EF26FF0|nr:glycosyltransferase 87 family protein [Actinoplanes capillaceus]
MRSGLVVLGALLTLAVITLYLQRYALSTLAVEHAAIQGWLDGADLYAYRSPGNQAGAALPPALAMLLAPLTLLPLRAAGWLLTVAGVAALLLTTLVVAGPVARRHGRRRTPFVLAAAACALLSEPVRATIGLGRPELLILALLAADLIALRRADRVRHRILADLPGPRRRSALDRGPQWFPDRFRRRLRRSWITGSWAGVGSGLAAALCAVPLLFIVFLLLTKQRRAAVTALFTAAVVTLAALAVAPDETLSWYGTVMWELDRPAPVSAPDNQSLAGVMARLYGFPAPPVLVWFAFGMLLLAVGLIRARSAHTDGDEVAAFTLVGLTGAITGPVSTSAETLWLLPAVLVLADTGMRRRLGGRLPRTTRLTGIAFLAGALLVYLSLLAPPSWSLTWNIPAFALILLVNTLPWRHGAPPLPTPRPGRSSRPAAIPLPRGG